MNKNTKNESLWDVLFNAPGNSKPEENDIDKNLNEGIEQDDVEEDINNESADDAFCENDSDDEDQYGHSYEKYGGYNGWSDDAIDDAFEGDPDATWNVD